MQQADLKESSLSLNGYGHLDDLVYTTRAFIRTIEAVSQVFLRAFILKKGNEPRTDDSTEFTSICNVAYSSINISYKSGISVRASAEDPSTRLSEYVWTSARVQVQVHCHEREELASSVATVGGGRFFFWG